MRHPRKDRRKRFSRGARTLRLNRMQTRSERQMLRELRAFYRTIIDQVCVRVRAGRDPAELEEPFRAMLRPILMRGWRRATYLARDELYDFLKVIGKKSIDTAFDEAVAVWLENEAVEKVVTFSRTFFDDVRTTLSDAFEDGMGQEEAARHIRKVAGNQYPQWMAARVARTENAFAFNMGSHVAAESTGEDMVKEWSTAEDARVRPTHAAADGQIQEMDEPFQVGEARLRFPGDPDGPAKEVINCRCVALYWPRINGEIFR